LERTRRIQEFPAVIFGFYIFMAGAEFSFGIFTASGSHDPDAGAGIMIRNIRILIAAALPIIVFALTPSAAMAQSYSGNWPATVSHSQHFNGTYCLALTDDGKLGWPHSGEASLVPQGNTYSGTFQLIDGALTITIPVPTGTAELESFLYIASASGGRIGRGVFEEAYGSEIDSGVLVFGEKGGC
jgi:hypothetical protein